MIKSRLEIKGCTSLHRDQFMRAECTTSSKGVVEKYTDGHIWIKTNSRGYESLAEVLASRVIGALEFDTVEYKPGFLTTDEYSAESVCISESYIYPGEEEISMGRLLQVCGGFSSSNEMYDRFTSIRGASERVDWIVDTLADVIDPKYLRHSLAVCVWLDSLVLNEDRHLFNLVFVHNADNRFRFVNFDYGGSLLSDIRDYSLSMPLHVGINKVKSKPFSTSFSRQLRAFADELPPPHKNAIFLAVNDLYDYYEPAYIQRCLDVLSYTLAQSGITLHLADGDTTTSVFH